MEPEIKGKHIAMATPPHPQDKVFSTEPLIIPVHLSGIPGKPLLQLLDSGTNVPLLYASGKDMAGGFSVSTPIRDRGPDFTPHIVLVLQQLRQVRHDHVA